MLLKNYANLHTKGIRNFTDDKIINEHFINEQLYENLFFRNKKIVTPFIIMIVLFDSLKNTLTN
jgi:hypothetical protein